MAEASEWQEADGTVSANDVLKPDAILVTTATRMCCPEHGLTRVVLLEVEGVHEHYGPYRFAVELTIPEATDSIGQALLEAKDR